MPSDESLSLDLRDAKALYKKASQTRYKRFKTGYRMDRWLFQAFMWALFLYLFLIARSYNYDLDYYECINPAGRATYYPGGGEVIDWQAEGCKNPFYKPDLAWKSQEYLPPGKYGTQLNNDWRWSSVFLAPFLALAGALALNHWIHNRYTRRRRKP